MAPQMIKNRLNPKIIIAHRGASGYLPEHTLPAKAMAYALGAHYLEQDLVMTKDDELIVLHDHYLDRITDVAKKYPSKKRADGRFYAIDFTLEEIRHLAFTEEFELINGKPQQVWPNRFPMMTSSFHIHTFSEEIEFIQGLNHSTAKNVGLYPEIKSPWFHQKEGKDISIKVLEVLKQYGYEKKSDLIYLQCFDPHELQRIKKVLLPQMGMDIKLIQLIAFTDWLETFEKDKQGNWRNYNYDWMFTSGAMKKIAEYADGIGPQYPMLIAPESTGGSVSFTTMLEEAHGNKLAIHPYTLRTEIIPDYATSLEEMFQIFYQQANVEGLFTDFTDKAADFLRKANLYLT